VGKGTILVPAAHGWKPHAAGDPEGVEPESLLSKITGYCGSAALLCGRAPPFRAGSETGHSFRGLHPRLFKGFPFGERMLPPIQRKLWDMLCRIWRGANRKAPLLR
jgi:hypothetical protein